MGAVFLLGALFWTGGAWQVMLFVLTLIAVGTALVGFCPLYVPFSWRTISSSQVGPNKKWLIAFAVVYIGALLGGGYASMFFTKKFFIEDFNAMNNFYKQTLFYTGQDKRMESVENYAILVAKLDDFKNKYAMYHPWAIRGDQKFNADMEKVSEIVEGLRETIASGDLHTAHLTLETVRPITQDILKRNNFSLLAISLVDFHDVMEMVIASADSNDAGGVISAYVQANEKLMAVEQEANDAEIQMIRKNLEAVLESAKKGDVEKLPAQAGELKSSFVKVYLVRG